MVPASGDAGDADEQIEGDLEQLVGGGTQVRAGQDQGIRRFCIALVKHLAALGLTTSRFSPTSSRAVDPVHPSLLVQDSGQGPDDCID